MPQLGLLDTSVFIASETGRRLEYERLPDESLISPMTLGELKAGVHTARDLSTRATRLAAFSKAQEFEQRPIDDRVADAWALLRAHLAETGGRLPMNDLWIAATALANRLPVYTQDDDFDLLEGVGGLEVVKV